MNRSVGFNLILVLFFTTAFVACKKKDVPPGDPGVVEFLFDGKVNGVNKMLEAGKNNYYMHSNYSNDAKGVLWFDGQLGLLTNKDSNEYLKISFQSYNGSQSPNLDTIFNASDYYSFSLDTVGSKQINGKAVQFTFSGLQTGAISYFWNFGDGTSSTLANPYHVYTKDGKVSVSCLVKYAGGIQDFLQNDIEISYGSTCQQQFSIVRNGDSLVCSANSGNGNFMWSFPNGTSAMGNTVVYTQPITLRDYITMSDSTSSCQTVYKQVVAPKNTLALVNYNYKANDTTYTEPINAAALFRSVIVEYYLGGKKYVSYKNDPTLNQRQNKIFHLHKMELYQKNTANQRTVKLNGDISTYLYNAANNTDSIFVYSNRLQLAVAIP